MCSHRKGGETMGIGSGGKMIVPSPLRPSPQIPKLRGLQEQGCQPGPTEFTKPGLGCPVFITLGRGEAKQSYSVSFSKTALLSSYE